MSSVQKDAQLMEPHSTRITRRSKSNLAFALACLPAEKRRDMVSFYAFCRVIDDIADDPSLSREDKEKGLDRWQKGIADDFENPDALESELEALRKKHDIPREHLLEILAGVRMDLEKKRYQTFEELREYCYRVACMVGLVSIDILGCRSDACREYAVNLGYALQLTNILRDVGQDLASDDRIYLPGEDMDACGYREEALRAGVVDERFAQLMSKQSRRAREYFRAAAGLLRKEDRRAMAAPELMRRIYSEILAKMEGDGFRVFEKRYRLGKLRMAGLLAGAWLGRWR